MLYFDKIYVNSVDENISKKAQSQNQTKRKKISIVMPSMYDDATDDPKTPLSPLVLEGDASIK